ncbi:MAG: hypothetical protein ACKOQ6_07240, partial [Bacteroidota bacterium]
YNEGVAGADTGAVDTVTISLVNPTSLTVFSQSKGLLSNNGLLSVSFPEKVLGNAYYIKVNHRNLLETWSATPIEFSTTTLYDFTDGANKAYGDNQTEVEPGVWAIYSGELNADGFIDTFDSVIWETFNIGFSFGYFPADLNGDGYVDTFDSPFLEQNNLNFVSALRP